VSKRLYEELNAMGLLEYGSVFSGELVRDIIDLSLPSDDELHQMTVGKAKSVFTSAALMEMAEIDYVRNILLGRGMYIKASGGGYVILLPSENAAQIDSYVSSADKKLRRALKLSRNTPADSLLDHTNLETRLEMKRKGAEARFRSGNKRT